MRKARKSLLALIPTLLVLGSSGTPPGSAEAAESVHTSDARLVELARDRAARIEAPSPSIRDLLTVQELVEMGEELFFDETFDGNGRTCGSCHLVEDDFGLEPSTIA